MGLISRYILGIFLLLMGLISRYILGIFLACASETPTFSSDFNLDSMDFSPISPLVVSIFSSDKSRFLTGLQSIFGTSLVVELILGTSPVVGASETAIFSPLSSFFSPDMMDLAIFFLAFPFLLLMGLFSRYIFGT